MHSLLFFYLLLGIRIVSAGQLFTQGLSVINSPSAGSPAHAESNLPISVDISGNGKLDPDAVNPRSTLPTRFHSLEIYLVSSETNLNITVFSGAAFLSSQSGTVRQVSWPVPACVNPGQYNLTFYETSQFEGRGLFTITPIPILVQNPAVSGSCGDVNTLLSQPQASNPLERSPFEQDLSTRTSATPTLLTITLPSGVFNFPTVTKTVFSATTTVVVMSQETFTTTVSGSTFTTTRITTLTTQLPDGSVFFPVNSSVYGPLPGTKLVWRVIAVLYVTLELLR